MISLYTKSVLLVTLQGIKYERLNGNFKGYRYVGEVSTDTS